MYSFFLLRTPSRRQSAEWKLFVNHVRQYFALVRMAGIKKTITSVGEDEEKLKLISISSGDGNVKWHRKMSWRTV